MTFGREIHPIGFVQLRTDKVVQIRDSVILSYERG
jgi:hypothetical protein